jgi:hypothetical protein
MEILPDSCTFGKVPKTTRNPFFDMLKKEKKGIENMSENNKYKVVRPVDGLITISRSNKD